MSTHDDDLTSLNTTLFPGVSSDAQVHNGFAAEYAKTEFIILDEVKKELSSSGASTVIAVSY